MLFLLVVNNVVSNMEQVATYAIETLDACARKQLRTRGSSCLQALSSIKPL